MSKQPRADLLAGVEAIAGHLDMTRRQVYHLHETGQLPTFKLGAKVCALRSVLREHFLSLSKGAANGKRD